MQDWASRAVAQGNSTHAVTLDFHNFSLTLPASSFTILAAFEDSSFLRSKQLGWGQVCGVCMGERRGKTLLQGKFFFFGKKIFPPFFLFGSSL